MKARSVSFALLLFGVAACSAMTHNSSAADQNEATVLQVDNRGFTDMTIYAMRSGQRVRLGLANGVTKTNLIIPSTLISGTPIRFVADPIGGTRASVSQEIAVTPGDTVIMTIPPG